MTSTAVRTWRGGSGLARLALWCLCLGGGACAAPTDGGDASADSGAGLDAAIDASADGGGDGGCACDDGVTCTRDACDARGACRHEVDPSACAEGEICDPTAGCVVVPCASDPECDDLDPCTGPELCVSGRCQAGTPPDCADTEPCTADGCSPGLGCEHTPIGCAPGVIRACASACGTVGTETCEASCAFGACQPPSESCNGLDDDCDGTADNGFECAMRASRSCATACGTTGSAPCNAGCVLGACEPPPESCNGVDDDCDGAIDEDCECLPGSDGPCVASCGSSGDRSCDASGRWGMCMPPSESCNGVDDDCDGAADDGFACRMGASTACLSACGSVGTQSCGAGCSWGACTPPSEICNGVDDDCDGVVDDGFTCASGATESCTASCGSTG
ncbi:MAG: hypothetical protein K8H88_26730, partial [Sandaracinaceae bacterium]|nr:hypothetical protein [Sandaracinaceae bacterium]